VRHQLPALSEQLSQLRVRLDGQARVVEAQPPALPFALGERGGEVLEQVAGDDLALERVGDLLGRLRRVAEVGEKAMAAEPRARRRRRRAPARGCR
jgi:hypothetical protein